MSNDDNIKTKTYADFTTFVINNKCSKGSGEETHQYVKDGYRTLFKVLDKEYKNFIKLYTKELKNNKVELLEKSNTINHLYFDFDIKILSKDVAYDANDIKSILDDIKKVIQKVYDINEDNTSGSDDDDNDKLKAYITTKNESTYDSVKKLYSNGFHIHFPNLILDNIDRLFIAQKVGLKLVKNESMKKIIETTKLKFEEIYDNSVFDKNRFWYLYGSGKNKNNKINEYVLKYIYDGKGNKCEIDNIKKSYLINILSLRNPNLEINTYIKNKYNDERDDYLISYNRKKEKTPKNDASKYMCDNELMNELKNEFTFITLKNEDLNNYNKAKQLVTMLSRDRATNYNDWIKVGWCLCGISQNLIVEFHEFSKQCEDKYDYEYCNKIWNDCINYNEKNKGYSIGTLYRWASEDNPEEYSKFLENQVNQILMNVYDYKDEFGIACIIKELYGREFVCSSISKNTWYYFDGNKWRLNAEAYSLSYILSTDFSIELDKLRSIYTTKATTEKGQKADELLDKQNKIGGIISKLRGDKYKETLFKTAKKLMCDEKFLEKLNDNDYLIGFNDGTYDLKDEVFKQSTPDDYISFSVGYKFPRKVEPETRNDIEIFLKSILPEDDKRTYVLCYIASMLEGGNKEQKFVILTGTGANGKGTLIELIDTTLTDYYSTVDVSLLTKKRQGSSAANPELADKVGKRLLSLEESDKNDQLQLGYMKYLTGQGKIQARPLYNDPFYYLPKFKICLLCNNLPEIVSDDGGTWRRIIVVDFDQKFVDEPKKPYEHKKDEKLREKLKSWGPQFMKLLLDIYYPMYKKNGLAYYECDSVKYATNKYKETSNHIGEFLETYSRTNDSNDEITVSDFYGDYEAWIRQNGDGKNKEKKSKFMECMKLLDYSIIYNDNSKPIKITNIKKNN